MDILRDLVYLTIIGHDEKARLKKKALRSTIEIPERAFSSDSVICRVNEWGPECKYAEMEGYYKKGDLVLVPKTMEIPRGRGIFVNEEDILCVLDPS
jgi:hypothetical protein